MSPPVGGGYQSLRVLHVITGLHLGGAEIMLWRYLRALGPRVAGHSVLSLLEGGAVRGRIEDLGVPVASLGIRYPALAPFALPALRRRVREAAADVLHGWMYHGNLACTLARAGMAGPRPAVIWSVHHSLGSLPREKMATRAVLRLSCRLSASVGAILFTSAVARDQHARLGYDVTRGAVIPNAVDAAEFCPDPAARARVRAAYGIPADRFLIGNVARAHPMKDHATLIRALAMLRDRGQPVHALIAGDGHRGGTTERMVADLALADRVTLAGPVLQVAPLVAGFDAFVLSSAWGETFSIATAEAMACGLPCIATEVGGVADLLGETGLAIPPADPQAIVAGVEALIGLGAAGRARLGQAARQRIADHYALPAYVAAHAAVYDRLRPQPVPAATGLRVSG
ncbi:glycosyltransferase [Frigidibacter oleivorans]|uniref:glycosyltransferase n=1 Tax=Frigidibacter oleivorans TaxID=2487129 RepID=UPI000F8C4883|nr:glycosyltransferase [Frigidibacter oleivorans]